jgi:hypothetical protein
MNDEFVTFFKCCCEHGAPLSALLISSRIFCKKTQAYKKLLAKKLRDPKVQIITVGHYCNLKMVLVVSRAQLLFVWSPCTTVYKFDGRFKHRDSARLRFQ